MSRGTEHPTCQERAPVLSRAPWHKARHPAGKSSDVVMCPEESSVPPDRKGLWCCHVPRGTEPVTQQERAPESPRASLLRTHPCTGRLRHHRVTEAPGPPPDRAPVSLVWEGFGAVTCPVALDPRACPCVSKTLDIRLIMVSSGTRCRQHIKCICAQAIPNV
jgi:hypothetical protein